MQFAVDIYPIVASIKKYQWKIWKMQRVMFLNFLIAEVSHIIYKM